MSDGSVRTNQLPVANGLAATDTVVVNVTQANGVANTCQVSVVNLLGNSAVSYLRIPASSPPASASSSGQPGTLAWDSSFLYLCVANNTWVRAALSSW